MTPIDRTDIVLVFGTTGELIKLYPIIRALEDMGIRPQLWCTAQQIEELPKAIESLGISTPIEWLTHGHRGHSLRSKTDVLHWLGRVSLRLATRFRRIRRTSRTGAFIVHGDTMTTAIAALFGRLGGGRVVHVEAGMRSGDIRNPFPEELSRRFVARVSDINYAPGAVPVGHLNGCRGDVIDTKLNTVVDALLLAQETDPKAQTERFGLVSLHRSELYENESAFREILDVLALHARGNKLVFIDHPVTVERIHELGLDALLSSPNIHRVEKLDYFDFIALLSRASYVVTDSGGLQQECEITGHPCAVHRAVTESNWKLDRNIVLSRLDCNVVAEFLKNPDAYRSSTTSITDSPTDIIISDLTARGII